MFLDYLLTEYFHLEETSEIIQFNPCPWTEGLTLKHVSKCQIHMSLEYSQGQ